MSLKGTISNARVRSFLSWSGFAKISMKRMFFHQRSYTGWFIYSFLVLPSFQGKLIQGTGHNKFVLRGPTFSGVGGLSKTLRVS